MVHRDQVSSEYLLLCYFDRDPDDSQHLPGGQPS